MNGFCNVPWTTFEIYSGGISCCCYANNGSTLAWRPLDIYRPLVDVWNDSGFQQARKALADLDYNPCGNIPCNKKYGLDCIMQGLVLTQKQRDNIERLKRNIEQKKTLLDSHPMSVKVCLDNRCNFRCRFCYLEFQRFTEKRTTELNLDRMHGLEEFLEYATEITVLGGEPTISKNFGRLMRMVDGRKVQLITNGSNVEPILEHKDKIRHIVFSIDGATKETYEYLRVHSNWETLLDNCRALCRNFTGISTNWVVTPRNVGEMTDFMDVAKTVGIGSVTFIEIAKGCLDKNSEVYDEDALVFKNLATYRRAVMVLLKKVVDSPIPVVFNFRSLGITSDKFDPVRRELRANPSRMEDLLDKKFNLRGAE